MDVRCDRCGTEYEFDDALLSERGTTVQCTECGFRFKVFPAHGAPAPERWIVRSGSGQGWEYQYGSLRDLQAAILRGAVGPDDVLSRGLEAPRPLASIAELEPLFAERPPQQLGRTLAGVAPQAGGSTPPLAGTGSRAPEPPTQAMPVKRRVSTKMGLPAPAEAPPDFVSASAPPPSLGPEPTNQPFTPTNQPFTPAPDAQARPAPNLGSTLLGMVAPRPVTAPASEQARPTEPVVAHKLGGMEVLPAMRSTAPHAPRIASELARTQRSVTEEERASYPASTVQPGSTPPSPSSTFGGPQLTGGSERQDLKQTLPSTGSEPAPPASPRPRVVSVLTTSEAPPPGAESLTSTLVTPVGPTVSSPAVVPTVTATMPTVIAPTPWAPGQAAGRAPVQSGFPSGTMPSVSSGGVPSGIPSSTLLSGTPSAAMPSGGVPSGGVSSTAVPQGVLPNAAAPQGPAPSSRFVSAEGSSSPTVAASGLASAAPSAVRVNVPVATSRAVPDDAPRTAPVAEPPVARPAVQPSIPADEELPSIPKRRGAARWLVALIVLGAGAIVAGTLGKPYLGRFLAPKPPPVVAAPDVAPLLAKADELYAAGDLEGAREQLGRADALTQSVGKPSAPVARKLARVDVAAADVEWLRLRLLAANDAERIAEVTRVLERRVERARSSVDAAARLGQDPTLAPTKVDLARLSGDVAGARALSGALPPESAESAYAQATLELSEAEPKYPVVIELLGKAVGNEGTLGLGRTALIYALVRSGDGARAQAELASMRERSASAAASPLLADLVSFVSRESGSASPAGSALSPVPSAALAPPAAGAPTGAPAPGAAPRMPTDFRARLTLASQALGRGELTQADTLYRSVLNEHPNNTEALAGLADVARRKGQSAEAARMYDQVLASNPSYLPALIGRADQMWAAGDRSGAIKLYRRVLDQVGTSNHYGQHAQSRINEAEGAPKSPNPTPAPDSSPIDTTDLE